MDKKLDRKANNVAYYFLPTNHKEETRYAPSLSPTSIRPQGRTFVKRCYGKERWRKLSRK